MEKPREMGSRQTKIPSTRPWNGILVEIRLTPPFFAILVFSFMKAYTPGPSSTVASWLGRPNAKVSSQ